MSEEKKNKISRSILSFINNVVLLIAIITSAAWIIMSCIGYVMLGSDPAAVLITLTLAAGGIVLIPFSILVHMLVEHTVIPHFVVIRVAPKAQLD